MWLDPVRQALDARRDGVDVFFRDDDAGWDDARLFQLLDVFADYETPIDLAVIPMALTASLATQLVRRRHGRGDLLGLHQHGCRHVNHETAGRKCEFGPTRARGDQWRDLVEGQARLEEMLGQVDPIFTPPWNRCTEVTADCLENLGFATLSQDRTAPRLGSGFLGRLPVAVDWCKWREADDREWVTLGEHIADALRAGEGPVGIMLHHAVMDEGDHRRLASLLSLLARTGRVQRHRMLTLARNRTPELHP